MTPQVCNQLLSALEACLAFIASEYADEEAKALDGHPIAREARKVWDQGWRAVEASEGKP